MSIANKLSIFAENATINNEDYTTTTAGLVYSDDAWKNVDIRNSGESTGIASSRRFNTALRQATFGSKLLGDILVARYGGNNGTGIYKNSVLNYDISADNISNNTADIISALSVNGNFIRDGEITANKIKDNEIPLTKLSTTLQGAFQSDGSTIKRASSLAYGAGDSLTSIELLEKSNPFSLQFENQNLDAYEEWIGLTQTGTDYTILKSSLGNSDLSNTYLIRFNISPQLYSNNPRPIQYSLLFSPNSGEGYSTTAVIYGKDVSAGTSASTMTVYFCNIGSELVTGVYKLFIRFMEFNLAAASIKENKIYLSDFNSTIRSRWGIGAITATNLSVSYS